MEVQENSLVLFGFFFFNHLPKDFAKDSRNMNIWEKGGNYRFQLVQLCSQIVGLLRIPWAFLNSVKIHCFFTTPKKMKIYHEFIKD